MAGNIFQDGMQAYDSTNGIIQGIQKKRADTQAAPMIAAGNFGGAAQAYGGAGLPDEARQNVVDQQVMTDRAAASDTRAKAEQAAEAQRKADGLLHVVDAVQAAPVGQRLARLQALAPAMHSLGVEASQLGAATEADLSDDKLASFKALVGKAAQDYTLGADQKRFSGATNQVVASGPPKPQEYLVLPEGGKAIPKPMNGETVGNPSAPALGASPAPSAPAAAGPASSQSRGVRNNNPLNITGQGWQGQTGSDGSYAVFSSPEAGQQAADKNLQAYATKHGINTLSGIINRWAPASGGNDTQSYIQTVASDLNIDPNQPLNLADPKVRAVVLHSMSKVELGGEPPAQAQPTRAALPAPTGLQPGDPPGTLYGNPKPDEKPLSPEGVAMVGAQYLQLGPDALKNMGQGKSGIANKNAVMEWAANTAKEAGTSNPQLVMRFAQNKANLEALKQNTKMLTQISASAHTLDANLDYAMTFAKRGVGPTGIPFMDTPINKLREQVGSVDAKNLDNLLTTTGNEYAKILSSTTGTGGATSDSARAEAQRLIHPGMTLRQLTSAVQIAKQEAENRRLSYAGENSRLTSDISGVPQVAPPAKVRRFNPATGRLE